MKVELNVGELKSALKALSKIKGKFISEDIMVKTTGDITTLSKSNIDTDLNISLIGYSEENGKIALSSGIVEIIKKLKDESLILTDRSITAGKKVILLQGVIESEYSNKETFKGDLIFTTNEKELHKMLEVKYAMSQDGTRPILNGIFFNDYETCAIDGYRVSVRRGSYDSNAKFVLNKNTVEILSSILDCNADQEVNVYGDEKLENIKFEIGSIEIIGKSLQGEFIKYKNIIPQDTCCVASIEMQKLKDELDFIGGIKTNLLRLNFTEDKLTLLTSQCKEEYDKEASETKTKELQLQVHNDYKEKYNTWATKKEKAEKNKKEFKLKCPEEKCIKPQKVYSLIPISDIKIEVDCCTKFEDRAETEFKIAVNPKYFIESMKTYSDKVEFRMNSSVSPIIITEYGKNLELVLPIRILN